MLFIILLEHTTICTTYRHTVTVRSKNSYEAHSRHDKPNLNLYAESSFNTDRNYRGTSTLLQRLYGEWLYVIRTRWHFHFWSWGCDNELVKQEAYQIIEFSNKFCMQIRSSRMTTVSESTKLSGEESGLSNFGTNSGPQECKSKDNGLVK